MELGRGGETAEPQGRAGVSGQDLENGGDLVLPDRPSLDVIEGGGLLVPFRELFGLGEEGCLPARVQEKDGLILAERAPSDEVDEAATPPLSSSSDESIAMSTTGQFRSRA